MRGRPSYRSSLTRCRAVTSWERMRRPGSCGTRSRQLSRPGASTGAVTILKSLASPALVRMKNVPFRLVDMVLDRGLARCDERRLRLRRVGRDEAHFRRLVVVRVDQDEAPRLRLADADEEAGVRLLVDENVGLEARAERVAEDARGAVVGVEPDVEEMPAVGRPDGRAAGVRNDVGKIAAVVEVAHRQRVEFRAGVVVRPGEEPMVGRMVRRRRCGNRRGPRRARCRRAGSARRRRRASRAHGADAGRPRRSASRRPMARPGAGTVESSSLMRPRISLKSVSCSSSVSAMAAAK